MVRGCRDVSEREDSSGVDMTVSRMNRQVGFRVIISTRLTQHETGKIEEQGHADRRQDEEMELGKTSEKENKAQ